MRPNVATQMLCLVLIANLTAGSLAIAQQSSDSAATAANTATPSTTTSPANTSTANGPLSDYVPCIFSEDDQFAMRAQPAEKPLDKRSAEQMFDNAKVDVEITLAKYSQSPEFLKAFRDYFLDLKNLSPSNLIGRTPTQAISYIRAVLYDAAASAADEIKGKPLHTDEQVKAAKENVAEALVAQVRSQLSRPEVKAELLDKKLLAGSAAISAASGALHLDPSYQTEVTNRYNSYVNRAAESGRPPTDEQIAEVAGIAAIDASGDPFPATAVSLTDNIATFLNQTDLSGLTQQVATKSQVKPFQPPNDVSCSMAVLSWKETRDIFGRRVANTFVAIQVTLRNLNTKNEFLVHDIQVAIDTGVTPDYFGRFQAGRDKLLVRAVAQRGQSDDRRNVVLNTLQTVGAIAAASSLTAGTVEFKDAVAVFQGAFMTGFANIFPDHTVEQLNHINDLVFSASNTSKVLVPVQGSVPLVTFISERPIEQMPFAWCGHPRAGLIGIRHQQNCNFNGGKHNPGYVTPYRYAGRKQLPSDKQQPPATDATQAASGYNDDYPRGPVVNGRTDDNGNDLPVEDGLPPWNDLQYRDWRGSAVRMLQEHTFVVVGGVHIQEVVTQPKVANLTCPQLKSGEVDISQTQDNLVNCTVNGTGLNLISAVDLDKTNAKIAGTVKVSTDGNSATLQFKPEDLCPAQGEYSLFATYKSDTQKAAPPLDTGNKVQLVGQPAVTGTPTLSGTKLTLDGACLNKITGASIKADNTTIDSAALEPASDNKKLTVTLKSAATANTKYSIQYTIAAQPGPIVPPLLSVTATAGTGSATPGPAGTVTLSPKSLTFASQKLKTTSTAKTVTLKNSGSTALTDVGGEITGAGSANFTKTTTCGVSLDAGKSCAFALKFMPTSAGKFTATLNVTYKGGESPQSGSVSLTGIGTP